MTIPRAELIAGLADRWHRRGAALPITHRRRILRALADVSPMLRSWDRWERLFSLLYLAGVACTSFGVLAVALDVWPLVTGGLVFAGTVTNALLAAHLVRSTRQALDIATGLAANR